MLALKKSYKFLDPKNPVSFWIKSGLSIAWTILAKVIIMFILFLVN